MSGSSKIQTSFTRSMFCLNRGIQDVQVVFNEYVKSIDYL